MRIETEIVIDCPAPEVFTFVSDPRNLPRWQPSATAVTALGDGSVALGERFTERRSFLGKHVTQTIEIVEYEPDELFTIRVTEGPLPLMVRHVFAPEGARTRLAVRAEVKLSGAMRFAGLAMAKPAEHEGHANLVRLKKLLEA